MKSLFEKPKPNKAPLKRKKGSIQCHGIYRTCQDEQQYGKSSRLLDAMYRHYPITQPFCHFRPSSLLIADSKAITNVPFPSQSPPAHPLRPLRSLFPNQQPSISLLSHHICRSTYVAKTDGIIVASVCKRCLARLAAAGGALCGSGSGGSGLVGSSVATCWDWGCFTRTAAGQFVRPEEGYALNVDGGLANAGS